MPSKTFSPDVASPGADQDLEMKRARANELIGAAKEAVESQGAGSTLFDALASRDYDRFLATLEAMAPSDASRSRPGDGAYERVRAKDFDTFFEDLEDFGVHVVLTVYMKGVAEVYITAKKDGTVTIRPHSETKQLHHSKEMNRFKELFGGDEVVIGSVEDLKSSE